MSLSADFKNNAARLFGGDVTVGGATTKTLGAQHHAAAFLRHANRWATYADKTPLANADVREADEAKQVALRELEAIKRLKADFATDLARLKAAADAAHTAWIKAINDGKTPAEIAPLEKAHFAAATEHHNLKYFEQTWVIEARVQAVYDEYKKAKTDVAASNTAFEAVSAVLQDARFKENSLKAASLATNHTLSQIENALNAEIRKHVGSGAQILKDLQQALTLLVEKEERKALDDKNVEKIQSEPIKALLRRVKAEDTSGACLTTLANDLRAEALKILSASQTPVLKAAKDAYVTAKTKSLTAPALSAAQTMAREAFDAFYGDGAALNKRFDALRATTERQLRDQIENAQAAALTRQAIQLRKDILLAQERARDLQVRADKAAAEEHAHLAAAALDPRLTVNPIAARGKELAMQVFRVVAEHYVQCRDGYTPAFEPRIEGNEETANEVYGSSFIVALEGTHHIVDARTLSFDDLCARVERDLSAEQLIELVIGFNDNVVRARWKNHFTAAYAERSRLMGRYDDAHLRNTLVEDQLKPLLAFHKAKHHGMHAQNAATVSQAVKALSKVLPSSFTAHNVCNGCLFEGVQASGDRPQRLRELSQDTALQALVTAGTLTDASLRDYDAFINHLLQAENQKRAAADIVANQARQSDTAAAVASKALEAGLPELEKQYKAAVQALLDMGRGPAASGRAGAASVPTADAYLKTSGATRVNDLHHSAKVLNAYLTYAESTLAACDAYLTKHPTPGAAAAAAGDDGPKRVAAVKKLIDDTVDLREKFTGADGRSGELAKLEAMLAAAATPTHRAKRLHDINNAVDKLTALIHALNAHLPAHAATLTTEKNRLSHSGGHPSRKDLNATLSALATLHKHYTSRATENEAVAGELKRIITTIAALRDETEKVDTLKHSIDKGLNAWKAQQTEITKKLTDLKHYSGVDAVTSFGGSAAAGASAKAGAGAGAKAVAGASAGAKAGVGASAGAKASAGAGAKAGAGADVGAGAGAGAKAGAGAGEIADVGAAAGAGAKVSADAGASHSDADFKVLSRALEDAKATFKVKKDKLAYHYTAHADLEKLHADFDDIVDHFAEAHPLTQAEQGTTDLAVKHIREAERADAAAVNHALAAAHLGAAAEQEDAKRDLQHRVNSAYQAFEDRRRHAREEHMRRNLIEQAAAVKAITGVALPAGERYGETTLRLAANQFTLCDTTSASLEDLKRSAAAHCQPGSKGEAIYKEAYAAYRTKNGDKPRTRSEVNAAKRTALIAVTQHIRDEIDALARSVHDLDPAPNANEMLATADACHVRAATDWTNAVSRANSAAYTPQEKALIKRLYELAIRLGKPLNAHEVERFVQGLASATPDSQLRTHVTDFLAQARVVDDGHGQARLDLNIDFNTFVQNLAHYDAAPSQIVTHTAKTPSADFDNIDDLERASNLLEEKAYSALTAAEKSFVDAAFKKHGDEAADMYGSALLDAWNNHPRLTDISAIEPDAVLLMSHGSVILQDLFPIQTEHNRKNKSHVGDCTEDNWATRTGKHARIVVGNMVRETTFKAAIAKEACDGLNALLPAVQAVSDKIKRQYNNVRHVTLKQTQRFCDNMNGNIKRHLANLQPKSPGIVTPTSRRGAAYFVKQTLKTLGKLSTAADRTPLFSEARMLHNKLHVLATHANERGISDAEKDKRLIAALRYLNEQSSRKTLQSIKAEAESLSRAIAELDQSVTQTQATFQAYLQLSRESRRTLNSQLAPRRAAFEAAFTRMRKAVEAAEAAHSACGQGVRKDAANQLDAARALQALFANKGANVEVFDRLDLSQPCPTVLLDVYKDDLSAENDLTAHLKASTELAQESGRRLLIRQIEGLCHRYRPGTPITDAGRALLTNMIAHTGLDAHAEALRALLDKATVTPGKDDSPTVITLPLREYGMWPCLTGQLASVLHRTGFVVLTDPQTNKVRKSSKTSYDVSRTRMHEDLTWLYAAEAPLQRRYVAPTEVMIATPQSLSAKVLSMGLLAPDTAAAKEVIQKNQDADLQQREGGGVKLTSFTLAGASTGRLERVVDRKGGVWVNHGGTYRLNMSRVSAARARNKRLQPDDRQALEKRDYAASVADMALMRCAQIFEERPGEDKTIAQCAEDAVAITVGPEDLAELKTVRLMLKALSMTAPLSELSGGEPLFIFRVRQADGSTLSLVSDDDIDGELSALKGHEDLFTAAPKAGQPDPFQVMLQQLQSDGNQEAVRALQMAKQYRQDCTAMFKACGKLADKLKDDKAAKLSDVIETEKDCSLFAADPVHKKRLEHVAAMKAKQKARGEVLYEAARVGRDTGCKAEQSALAKTPSHLQAAAGLMGSWGDKHKDHADAEKAAGFAARDHSKSAGGG